MQEVTKKEIGNDFRDWCEHEAAKTGAKVGEIREAVFLSITGHVGWEIALPLPTASVDGKLELVRANQ